MNFENPKTPEQNESEIIDFILKLSESESPLDDDTISAIVNQLKLLSTSPNLPDIIFMLSPSEHHPQTNNLSEIGKQRLDKALDIFTTPQ